MINRVEFRGLYETFGILAVYTSVYDFDYGTTECASELGFLTQEARSISFSLIADDFLRSFFVDEKKYAKVKITIFDDNNDKLFAGFLKDFNDGYSLDEDRNTVKIECVDLAYFVQNAKTAEYMANTEMKTNDAILLALISGTIKRYYDMGAFPLQRDYLPDSYFVNQGYIVISNEMGFRGFIPTNNDAQRVKVRNPSGDEFFYRTDSLNEFITDEKDILNEAYAFSADNSTDEKDILNEAYAFSADNSTVTYHYLDMATATQISGTTAINIKGAQYSTSRTSPEILGEKIVFKQTYSPFANVDLVVGNFQQRLYYKSNRKTTATNSSYYLQDVYPTELSINFIRKHYDVHRGYYTDYPTTDAKELLVWTESNSQDKQFAVFIDYEKAVDDGGEYIKVYIHYLVKLWGVAGKSYADIDTPYNKWDNEDKATTYTYRKRTLKFRGYSLFYDNFDSNFESSEANRAYSYETCSSYAYNGSNTFTRGQQNYALSDHWSADNTSHRDFYLLEDSWVELDGLSQTIKNCKFGSFMTYDAPAGNGFQSFSNIWGFEALVNGVNNKYSFNIGSFDRYEAYDTTSRISINFSGQINLDRYIYSDPINLYDAFKLTLMSNLFGIISDSQKGELQIVNKVPILDAVVINDNDCIELEYSSVKKDEISSDVFSPLAIENRDKLSVSIKAFIEKSLALFNTQISFIYSTLFSLYVPKIGGSFVNLETKYSITSVSQKTDHAFNIRAIKNGESDFYLSDDGINLNEAQLSNDGIVFDDWIIREI
jgi:hypothetical protein